MCQAVTVWGDDSLLVTGISLYYEYEQVQWSHLVWPPLLPGQSDHIRGVVSCQVDIYTEMWDLAPDFSNLIIGGIALQRGSHNMGTIALHSLNLSSSIAVSRVQFPKLGEHFLQFMCGASWLSGTGSMCHSQVRDCRFDHQLGWLCYDAVPLGKAFYPHVHSLNPGVSGYLAGHWRLLCVGIVSSTVMTAGLCAPQGVEMAYEWTGPVTRG